MSRGRLSTDDRAFLRNVDINRFVTGTLDSICEDALSGAREPGERPLVVRRLRPTRCSLVAARSTRPQAKLVNRFATILGYTPIREIRR